MTEEVSAEVLDEQDAMASSCSAAGVGFKLWVDEKYFMGIYVDSNG